jgi:TDG/mug DNA glycosylase family protein
MSSEDTKRSFPPIINEHSRLLILGSLPGDASLRQGHYYAHPRNAFWPLLSHILQHDLCALSFELRYQTVLQQQIALWDVIHSAKRSGSLDAAIMDAQANCLTDLLAAFPNIEHVIFNGQTAAKHGTRLLPGYILQSIAPSSSPAHTMPFSQKLLQWQAIFTASPARQN